MYDKTVEFLAKAVALIPTNYPNSAILKSHFITKCRDAEYDKKVTLAKSKFGSNILCKRCGNPWNEIEKIRIKRTRKFKHQNRLLKKQAHSGSKFESIKKKIQKIQLNKMVRICKFCKDYTYIEQTKRKSTISEPINTIAKITVTPSTPKIKKTKKRKKDIFAGLNKSIVRKSTPSSARNKVPIKILSETPKASSNLNKLAKALTKDSSPGSSIMKLLK